MEEIENVEQVEEEVEYFDDEIRQALEKNLEKNEDYSMLKNVSKKKEKKQKQNNNHLSFQDFSKLVDKIEESKKPKKFMPSKLKQVVIEQKRKFNPRFPPYKFENNKEILFNLEIDTNIKAPITKGAWQNMLKIN
jgi:hypothetical protein